MSEEPAPPLPPPPVSADRSLAYAVAASVLLVGLAVAGGLTVSRLSATPLPTPIATAVRSGPASPAPTEPPSTDTGPLVFIQPLSAGCAAGDTVYVVSDGGAMGAFVADRWQLIDPIARTLVAAACQGDRLVAVGGGGRVVTINDREQTIRSDQVQLEDLVGVATLPDGVLAVGKSGTVQRQDPGGWGQYAQGITDDLTAVIAFGPTSAWAVGMGGVSFRLEPAGWRPVPTGVTSALRAVSATAVDDAVAAGDDGVVLVWSGRWQRIANVPTVGYRAVLRAGAVAYAAGDGGTLVRFSGAGTDLGRIDLGTTCTLRALFARGDEVWVIGSDGAKAAVWRITKGTAVFRWGECP
ncbi:MAG TPA: hypothetical protein VGA38_09925 [Candidatus Limnocylindria bacterium]